MEEQEQEQEEEVTTNISANVIDATHVTELMLHPFTLAINPSHRQAIVTESCNSQEFGGLLSYDESPRKKRIKIGNESGGGGGVSKSKKRPDPFAPKITAPCAVCGRKFWSWKALFGHMRCHPERQWRGINPPPPPEGAGGNHRRQQQQQQQQCNNNCGEGTSTTTTSSTNYNISSVSDIIIPNSKMTEEEHTVATSLLLLAKGPSPNSQPPSCCGALQQVDNISSLSCGRFECSSCKKVFGSHQALGGHRASHRNVKGCFQIARNYEEDDDVEDQLEVVSETCTSNHHHECSICHRVFSSGQALGGHKRCHWEKGEASANNNKEQVVGVVSSGMWDLNLPPAPPPLDDNISFNCSYYSSPLVLDLRLGL